MQYTFASFNGVLARSHLLRCAKINGALYYSHIPISQEIFTRCVSSLVERGRWLDLLGKGLVDEAGYVAERLKRGKEGIKKGKAGVI